MKISKLVSEDTLKQIATKELQFLAKERPLEWQGKTVDEFGDSASIMLIGMPKENRALKKQASLGPINPWMSVKAHIRLLFCTNDPLYAPLRKQLKSSGKHAETTVVSMVAAGVAVHVGIALGALVPLCALCLLGILKVGQNAYCEKVKLEIPIEDKPKKGRKKKIS